MGLVDDAVESAFAGSPGPEPPGLFRRGLSAAGTVGHELLPSTWVNRLFRGSARNLFDLPVPDTATVGPALRSGLGANQGDEGYVGKLVGKGIEFAGDVGLDPLTYIAGGVGGIAAKGAAARSAIGPFLPEAASAIEKAVRAGDIARKVGTIGGAGFTGLMGMGAIEEGKRAYETLQHEGFSPQAAEEVLGTALSAGGAGLGLAHLAGGLKPTETPRLKPFEEFGDLPDLSSTYWQGKRVGQPLDTEGLASMGRAPIPSLTEPSLSGQFPIGGVGMPPANIGRAPVLGRPEPVVSGQTPLGDLSIPPIDIGRAPFPTGDQASTSGYEPPAPGGLPPPPPPPRPPGGGPGSGTGFWMQGPRPTSSLPPGPPPGPIAPEGLPPLPLDIGLGPETLPPIELPGNFGPEGQPPIPLDIGLGPEARPRELTPQQDQEIARLVQRIDRAQQAEAAAAQLQARRQAARPPLPLDIGLGGQLELGEAPPAIDAALAAPPAAIEANAPPPRPVAAEPRQLGLPGTQLLRRPIPGQMGLESAIAAAERPAAPAEAPELPPEARAGERRAGPVIVPIERRIADRRAELAPTLNLPVEHPAVDLAATAQIEARTDQLTGLGNRRAWDEMRASINPETDQVFALDMKKFKPINDTYGHDQGDVVLKKVAEILAEHLGQDNVARSGGDEFSAALRGMTLEEAQAKAADIQRVLQETTVDLVAPDGSRVTIPGLEAHIGVGRNAKEADLTANAVAAESRKGGRGDVPVGAAPPPPAPAEPAVGGLASEGLPSGEPAGPPPAEVAAAPAPEALPPIDPTVLQGMRQLAEQSRAARDALFQAIREQYGDQAPQIIAQIGARSRFEKLPKMPQVGRKKAAPAPEAPAPAQAVAEEAAVAEQTGQPRPGPDDPVTDAEIDDTLADLVKVYEGGARDPRDVAGQGVLPSIKAEWGMDIPELRGYGRARLPKHIKEDANNPVYLAARKAAEEAIRSWRRLEAQYAYEAEAKAARTAADEARFQNDAVEPEGPVDTSFDPEAIEAEAGGRAAPGAYADVIAQGPFVPQQQQPAPPAAKPYADMTPFIPQERAAAAPAPIPRAQKPGQAAMFAGQDMLQGTARRVTEGREGEGPLFMQEADARARAEAAAQTTIPPPEPPPTAPPAPVPEGEGYKGFSLRPSPSGGIDIIDASGAELANTGSIQAAQRWVDRKAGAVGSKLAPEKAAAAAPEPAPPPVEPTPASRPTTRQEPPPSTMRGSEINEELDVLGRKRDSLHSMLIRRGRWTEESYERMLEQLRKRDPGLAESLDTIEARSAALRSEIAARSGRNPPRRLPAGSKPRAKLAEAAPRTTRIDGDAALARMRDRMLKNQRKPLNLVGFIEGGGGALKDIAIYGASLMERGLRNFPEWSRAMMRTFSGMVTDLGAHLERIYKDALFTFGGVGEAPGPRGASERGSVSFGSTEPTAPTTQLGGKGSGYVPPPTPVTPPGGAPPGPPTPASIARGKAATEQATLGEQLIEAHKGGLVSGLGTPVSNVLSTAANTVVGVPEAGVAPLIDRWLTAIHGGPRTRFSGEALEQARGGLSALIRSGPNGIESPAGRTLADAIRSMFSDAENWGAIGSGPNASPLAKKVGKFIRGPLMALKIGDKFTDHINESAVKPAFALREAKRQLPGGTPAEIEALKQQLIANPTPELKKAIRAEVSERQFHGKEQDPGSFIKKLINMRSEHKWLHAIFPFIETPAHIADLTIQRSPLGFVKAGRAYNTWRRAVKGGAAPELIAKLKGEAVDAITRPLVGTMILGTFGAAAKAGMMTGSGPTDPRQRRVLRESGWQPYSFRFGNSYIPYNRFEPISGLLGFAADMQEARNSKDANDLFGKAIDSIGQNLLSKTYLQGLAEAGAAIADPGQALGKFVSNTAGSFVPNIVAKTAQAIDPVVRDTSDESGLVGLPGRTLKTVASRLPGISQLLPAQRSGTGEPVERPGNAFTRFALPVQPSQRKPYADFNELLVDIGAAPSEPQRELVIPNSKGKTVRLSEDELDVISAANAKATDYLRRVTRSPSFQQLGPEDQKSLVQRTYARYRTEARQRLYRRPSFATKARAVLRETRAQ